MLQALAYEQNAPPVGVEPAAKRPRTQAKALKGAGPVNIINLAKTEVGLRILEAVKAGAGATSSTSSTAWKDNRWTRRQKAKAL